MDEIRDILDVAVIASVGYFGWKKLESLESQSKPKNIVNNLNLKKIFENKPTLNFCEVENNGLQEDVRTQKSKINKSTELNINSKIIKKRHKRTIQCTERREYTTTNASIEFHAWLTDHHIKECVFEIANILDVDDNVFLIMTRMSRGTFDKLLSMIDYKLAKHAQRETIPPNMRLFVAITYLAHGLSFDVLTYIFRIGRTTVRRIIHDVCTTIWDNLMPAYLPPAAHTKWHEIAQYNEKIWGLPNCVSILDLRNIHISCRDKNFSKYLVRKGKLPMSLLFSCDAKHNFTGVSTCVINVVDGPAYAESTFGEQLLNGKIELPPKKLVENSNIILDHYFLGNSNFTLKTNIMRSYGKINKKEKPEHINFNKFLLRARRTMDNALSLLLNKWRILQPVLDLKQESVERVLNAVVVLHNFTKAHESTYFTEHDIELLDEHTDEIIRMDNWNKLQHTLPISQQACSNNASKEAKDMRDKLNTYLKVTGKI